MSPRAEFDALLRRLYAARAAGKLEELCALFAPHASFEISGASRAKPVAIRASGVTQYKPWLTLLLKTFRLHDLTLVSIIIDGDSAAVHWRADILSKITGAVVPTELIDLIKLDDGRIVSYFEMFNDR
jgi:ketosteroid isomerase-like protein